MRARMWALGALWLCACSEGVAPRSPVGQGPAPSGPLVPADVTPGNTPSEPKLPPPLPPLVASTKLGFAPTEARAINAVSAVDVDLVVSGVNGQGQVDAEFIAPGSMPYERRSVQVSALPAETRTVRFSLPVAGTNIASSGMAGAWEARFFVNGEPVASAAFTLEP